MNYIKLVNFEVQRFFKLFMALTVVVVIAQIAAAILSTVRFKNNAEQTMRREMLSLEAYGDSNYALYSIRNYLNEAMFQFSIMFAVAMLIIYVFFIWYRDWFGKSSFIYRLLMLPTARTNVYFAKLTTILLCVFCLLGVQIVLIEIVQMIAKTIIPAGLLVEESAAFMFSSNILAILYPQTMSHFLLSYGLGMVFVAIIFTAILFERSFHLKGIFLAGLYSSLSLALLYTPLFINDYINYFYVNELLLLTGFTALIVFALAVFLANYLLKRKINV